MTKAMIMTMTMTMSTHFNGINIIQYDVPLRASRRLRLSSPKRQTLRLPSDVMRSLLHVPQKCSLMEVMKPTLNVKIIQPKQTNKKKDGGPSSYLMGVPSRVACSR